VLPYLRELGRRWEAGEASVAQEHFASNVLRGRLLGLARGWDGGSGPRALLLCPTGEEHDLGLVCFGLMLRGRGWRITLLGREMPADALEIPARRLAPDAVVVAALTPGPLATAAAALRKLARRWPVYIGGGGADDKLARRCGATLLEGDPAEAAIRLAG